VQQHGPQPADLGGDACSHHKDASR
jgi:hypothetical protein